MADAPPRSLAVILSRQLASNLATPVFIVDAQGDLVFYNEPAERILGRSYAETGILRREEWATMFVPTDSDGNEIPPDELPLSIALLHGRPAHRPLRIVGLDGVGREIGVTAFPLFAHEDELVGAVAIFWEESP